MDSPVTTRSEVCSGFDPFEVIDATDFTPAISTAATEMPVARVVARDVTVPPLVLVSASEDARPRITPDSWTVSPPAVATLRSVSLSACRRKGPTSCEAIGVAGARDTAK